MNAQNKRQTPTNRDCQLLALMVHERLLQLYGEPVWRNPLPPLDELVSTILSQNTNDNNRDAAFATLKSRFPTWEEVRDAPVEEIMQAIRTAGLANQKAPRIKKVLQQITQQVGELDLTFLKDKTVDEAREWLLKFKGVGPKTAAIVLLFSLDKPAFPVDTHIYRVAGRLGLRPSKMSVEKAHTWLERCFPPETYYAAHLNIIRLGREICKACTPDCPNCPLNHICDFYKKGTEQISASDES